VTAADDPTLGGLLGPEPKRVEGALSLDCSVCGRDIRHGRPYVMVSPGIFRHRGPCVVVRAPCQAPS
jgi:hypothetical protein